jgi:hypothetical protein
MEITINKTIRKHSPFNIDVQDHVVSCYKTFYLSKRCVHVVIAFRKNHNVHEEVDVECCSLNKQQHFNIIFVILLSTWITGVK